MRPTRLEENLTTQPHNGVSAHSPRRFVIMGLPRSGTTYLMTLLNAHPRVFCSGEQFNPHAIVGIGEKNTDRDALRQRDGAPVAFMDAFFARHARDDLDWIGFKFMIGHNIAVLRRLEQDENVTLIHVHRENRLAQVSSLIKAAETKRWAQIKPDEHIERKVRAGPYQISQRWHEYETFDHLFAQWFAARAHRKLALEYREMFRPGFAERLCGFLGVAPDPQMRSPLVKQGSNTILERFENRGRIERYFRSIGRDDWLEDEL